MYVKNGGGRYFKSNCASLRNQLADSAGRERLVDECDCDLQAAS